MVGVQKRGIMVDMERGGCCSSVTVGKRDGKEMREDRDVYKEQGKG